MKPATHTPTLFCLLCLFAGASQAQQTLRPTRGTPSSPVQAAEIAPPPEPLVINGKLDRDLTDDERREWLQSKVRTIWQEDGRVEILHVAPGYPVTLRFSEPVLDLSIGDGGLVNVQKRNRIIEIAAAAPEGDTPLKVFFPGDRVRLYHVFVVDSFLKGDSTVTVSPFTGQASGRGANYKATPDKQRAMLGDIIRIIGNFDAMAQEGALDKDSVRRDDLFQRRVETGFALYHRYQIGQAAAWSFEFENRYPASVRLDESRLRLLIGNMMYIPDYVSLHASSLASGAKTTGFAVFFAPPFRLDQPMQLVWR